MEKIYVCFFNGTMIGTIGAENKVAARKRAKELFGENVTVQK